MSNTVVFTMDELTDVLILASKFPTKPTGGFNLDELDDELKATYYKVCATVAKEKVCLRIIA